MSVLGVLCAAAAKGWGWGTPLLGFAAVGTVAATRPKEPEPVPIDTLLTPILDRAYGFALRLSRNRADAEDLVQEAALLAVRGYHTFQPGTNFKAWFFRILTNCYYSRYRRNRHESSLVDIDSTPELFLYVRTAELGMHAQPGDNPAHDLIDRLDSEQVAAALETLPEEYRVVSTLYFIDDLAYEDIAQALQIPVGTVRSRLHRGRKILQRSLWRIALERGIVQEGRGPA